jgi:hypothetical protein
MQLSYQIKGEDLVRRLVRRRMSQRDYRFSLSLFFLSAVVAFLLGGSANPYPGLLLVLYAVSRPILLRSSIARMVRTNPTLTDPISLTVDDAGLKAVGPDWQTTVPWRHFHRWAEDSSGFFFERGTTGIGPMIPKSVMTDEQQRVMRQYLAALR